jgi:hypothetical protein
MSERPPAEPVISVALVVASLTVALPFSIVRQRHPTTPKQRLTISMIRSAAAMATLVGMDKAPTRARRPLGPRRSLPREARSIWIQMPIAEAEGLSPSLEMPRFCEALRCQSKPRRATTVHALIAGNGEANFIWVACADCTGLMFEGAYATSM